MPDAYDELLDSLTSLPKRGKPRYDEIITQHATRTGLDPELIRRVVVQESGGNSGARSWAGAQGLGQLMPATARRYGVKNPNDPDENIRGATDYLRDLMTEFGTPEKVLAAYNAGEGRVRKLGYERTRTLSNLPKGDPRRGSYVGSTGQYVDKILKGYQKPEQQRDEYDSLLDEVSGKVAQPGQSGDAYDELLDSIASPVTAPTAPTAPPPITRRATRFGAPRGPIKQHRPRGPFADVQAGVSGVAPDTSMGAFRQIDDPETSRILRVQREVTAQQSPAERNLRLRPGARLMDAQPSENEEVIRRVTEEKTRAAEEANSAERYKREKPEIDRLAKEYRQAIRVSGAVEQPAGGKWKSEALAKGVSGLTEKLAALVRFGQGSPMGTDAARTADTINVHAQAMHQAAVEEGADRNVASKAVQDIVGGFVASSPELAAMSLGVPAPIAFGAGEGLGAYGGNRPVAPAVAHGVVTGTAFGLGAGGKGIAGVAKHAGAVGGATTGIELATGHPIDEALKTGATNALLVGVPGAAKLIRRSPVSEAAQPKPREYEHLQFGRVKEAETQTSVPRGKVKVVDESGAEHVIQKPKLTGAGNQRAVPIKEAQPAEVKPPETAKTEVAPVVASTPEITRPIPSKEVIPSEPTATISQPTQVVPEPITRMRTELPPIAREVASTAAKGESMAADRAALDLPELSRPVRRKDIDVFEAAKEVNRIDPTEAGRVAEKVLSGRHTLTDRDTALLDMRASEIKAKHSQALKEIVEATDPEVIVARGADADLLRNEFDRLSQAADTGGTELARALRIRRRSIDDRYELLPMLAEAKKAKGRELKPEERQKIETQAKQIEELTQKLTEAEQRAQAAIIQKQIDKTVRQRKRSETKESLDTEFAELKSLFVKAKAELPRVQASGLASLDPEGTLTKLVGQMAKNRAKAGLNSAEALVTEVYNTVKEHVEGITKEDVAIIIRKTLSESDDVLSRWDKRRQTQLIKQQGELQERLAAGDFSAKPLREPPIYNRETFALQKQINETKAIYERELYRATRGTQGKIADTVAGVGNLPKTMLSMADVSALLRQGGYGSVTHPVLSSKAAVDMVRSMSGRGFANVQAEIKNHPRFEEAKRNGIEFTGIEKDNPQLSKREEGYLGAEAIDTLAKGKLNPLRVVKGVKDVSERTFVSFLDSQRMRIYDQQSNAIRGMKMTRGETDVALKAQAKLINIATGRGNLGEMGNKIAPVLNVAMFSPRLLASRVQLLNKMFNPVAWANTPRGARKLMMIDNAKFLGFTAITLGLAKAAGLGVSLDPDDADFLKIKVGDTRYDTLTGLQQPMRFMYHMANAVKGGEFYAGETKSDILMDFTRSKASPSAGYGWDYIEGKNRLSGKKFEAGKDLARTVTPLPIQEFAEAVKHDGTLRGIVETLPSLVGVGVQTYEGAAEKPATPAEKLARRMIIRKMPDTARDQDELDKSQKVSDLRARSRRGEDILKELPTLKLSPRQEKSLTEAKGKTRLQEDFNRLSIEDAILVYRGSTRGEQELLRPILQQKSTKVDELTDERQVKVKALLESIGMKPGQVPREPRPARQARQMRQSPGQGYVFR